MARQKEVSSKHDDLSRSKELHKLVFEQSIVREEATSKEFQLLYEWVEDKFQDCGSVLASEVRNQGGIIVGESFGKYKRYARLSDKINHFLELKLGITAVKLQLKQVICYHSKPTHFGGWAIRK